MNAVTHYLLIDNERKGPFTIGQLRSMWQSGSITSETPHHMDGYSDWMPLDIIVPDLEPSQPVRSGPAYAAGPPRPVVLAKSRGVYIILGLFLGGLLGIHNFYAGRYLPAVFQLVITIFTGWLIIPLVVVAATLPTKPADAYKDLVDALAILTEGSNRLAKLETAIKDDYIDSVDPRRKEYSDLQNAISKAEQAVKDIATLNPQWFTDGKTLATPYGKVQSRSTTKLEVPNEEVSIALLQQLGPESAPFLRVKTELNLEALGSLPDGELARVRINRVTSESLTVTPAKLDLGKAAKAAEAKAKKTQTAESK